MNIRLIAIDIDHTLLTTHGRPHERSATAIHRAVDSGVHVVLASGRYIPNIRVFADELLLKGPLIGSNGAHVVDELGGDLSLAILSPAVVERIFEFAKANHIETNVYTKDSLYRCLDAQAHETYVDRTGTVTWKSISFDQARLLPIVKLLLVDERDRVKDFVVQLKTLITPLDAHVTTSEPEYLEILPPAVNKGSALKIVAEYLGVNRSETAAIGDYHNDLEMIRWAGVGGAVRNAAPEVISAADRVVGSNDEGGVGEFINLLLS